MENRKNLGAYLGLLDFVNGNKIKVRDLEHAVGLAKNMHNLERERESAIRVRHRHTDGHKKVV
jgi:hypothetical protein